MFLTLCLWTLQKLLVDPGRLFFIFEKYMLNLQVGVDLLYEISIDWHGRLSSQLLVKYLNELHSHWYLSLFSFQITTLGKKRNATEFTVVISSVLLTGLVVLGDSFIRHVIDLFDEFIQAERHQFQCVILEFGISHGWSVVTSSVCCFNRLFLLLIAWSAL